MSESTSANSKIAHPMSWLERLGWMLLAKSPNKQQQLNHILTQAKQRQILEPEAFDMIEGVLQVSQIQVREAMIPRSQMITIAGDLNPEQAIPQIIAAGHSRFPVTGKPEGIVGILLAKDLLPFQLSQEPPDNVLIQSLVRPCIFTPESKRLNILLREFRLNRNHMAIVVDEYGEVSGLITIEDVLEEIVGDIADEYDTTAEPWIKKGNNNEFTVKALTPIEEFNQYFNTHYSNTEVDTVGGLMLQKLGHFPKRGESVTLDGFKLTVLEASRRGIQVLQVNQITTD